MAIYNYRCSDKRNCGARITLAHPYEWYIRKPKRPACKRDRLKVDPSVRRQRMGRICRCGGLHFPHAKGTYLNEGAFCEHALVDLDFQGSRVTEMRPDEDCPF